MTHHPETPSSQIEASASVADGKSLHSAPDNQISSDPFASLNNACLTHRQIKALVDTGRIDTIIAMYRELTNHADIQHGLPPEYIETLSRKQERAIFNGTDSLMHALHDLGHADPAQISLKDGFIFLSSDSQKRWPAVVLEIPRLEQCFQEFIEAFPDAAQRYGLNAQLLTGHALASAEKPSSKSDQAIKC